MMAESEDLFLSDIAEKIRNNTYSIVQKRKSRSEIWEFFGEV